uniref:Cadherin-1 n=1 Tax=Oryzias sinensis TaxID=183150 RepID=A0A8C8DL00_9TELE
FQKLSSMHKHPDVAVLYFPKASNGLRRRKRAWVIPPINIPENNNGPFPFKIVQIRSDEDKMKKIHYSITGPGANKDPVGLFTMDEDTGYLYVHQRLDREKQAHYKLFAHADSAGSSKVEDPMEIIINVIDMNDNKPIFEQTSYVAEVSESSEKGTTVIQVKATDADEPGNDNSIIKYTILSQEPKLPSDSMFAINSFNGAIMVEGVGLDREKYPEYTLEIQAADLDGNGLTGRTTVVLNVTDSNDNPPLFTASTYQGSVDENAVGVQVVKMSVTDEDEPNTPAWNAKFKIIRGDPDKLFSIETGTNKQEGIIKTAQGLDFEKIRKHTLTVIVENDILFTIPLVTSTATVVVTVKDVNEPPIFKEKEMTVQKREDFPVDSVIMACEAEDPDFARENTVKFKIIDDPENWLQVDEDSGLVKVKSLMDRESPNVKENKYTVLLSAYDDGRCWLSDQSWIEQENLRQTTICGIKHLFASVIAVLGLYAYKRRQKKGEIEEPFEEDIIRDSLYHYAEEGGGEDDQQDFVLRICKSIFFFRNDFKMYFFSIFQNLKAADEDPTASPYDSLLVFDLEGGGSDAGNLSSLNSGNSGDQDYNCLTEWGPRFKKLADMYGGGEDDDDML